MRDILLEIVNNDTTYNKSATRYLHKRHPLLWQQIVQATQFLPILAKPKQRVWHVLNDVWEIPVCPVTGHQVKWWDNRYLETIDRSAKATKMNKTGKLKNQTAGARAKRQRSLLEIGSNRKKPLITEEILLLRKSKAKATFLEKYGVDNPSKAFLVKQKIYQTQVANGTVTPKEKRSLRDLYYARVIAVTKKSWIKYFDKINPNGLNRSKYDLDHMFSIHKGFKKSIPPAIIGHWTNLQMLEPAVNYSKGSRCHKTLESLYEDYFASEVDSAILNNIK